MSALAAFARVDVRNVGRDSLLSVIVASPLLLALALRAGYPAAERWAATAHGLQLASHRGLLLGFLVVVHVAFIFGMVGALLVLDDADDHILLALRVTPVTLEGYVDYRAATVASASLLGLALAVPVSGLANGLGLAVVPALLLTAACAPLLMFATLALATNKVEGLAVIKLLAIPLYLPLVTWFADGGWTWTLAVLPTFWPVRALWAGLDGRLDLTALTVGTTYSAALLALLRRRTLKRV